MKRILFAASECVPFIKTGGLADVCGALPKEFSKEEWDVRVVIPNYSCIPEKFRNQFQYVTHFYMCAGNYIQNKYVGILKYELDGVTYYFIDNQEYFTCDTPYGDIRYDIEKFVFFDKAVLSMLKQIDFRPDLIHCHDWETGLIPVYLKNEFQADSFYWGMKSIITIHNLKFQGVWDVKTMKGLTGFSADLFAPDKLEFHKDANMLKGGLVYADYITTVSDSYAQEIQTDYYGEGLDGLLAARHFDMQGIVNGIDTAVFDPATDPVLPAHYSVRNLRGKATCKKALQQELGLQVQSDVPVISMVSRLVGHKGIDLICESLDNIMRTGCQLVLQGSGEEQYESFFRYAENRYKGRLCAYIGYNEDLAHRIYAGSDLFLMPSRSEPCGLSQMIAMRYGAVPIVRQTGGLADTVRSCQMGQEDGNGFVFANYSAFDMQYVISQAVELYRSDLHGFRRVQRCGMTDDFSWNVSAGAYEALYENITDTSR